MTTSTERQFERSEHRFTVQLATGRAVHQVESRDVSLGGMGLSGCPKLALGEPVKLFVSAEAGSYDGCRLLLLLAIPVWQKDDEVGLRFLDVPPDVRQDLSVITHRYQYA